MLFIHHAAVYPGSPTWSSLKLGGGVYNSNLNYLCRICKYQ